MNDIAGTKELGIFGRGEHIEISTFNNRVIKSEISGNIISEIVGKHSANIQSC